MAENFVSLNKVFLPSVGGGHIEGDLEINGKLTINDKSGNSTYLDVADKINDSDIVVNSFTTVAPFVGYAKGFNPAVITCYKSGNVVSISGQISSTQADILSSATKQRIGKLPEGFEPPQAILIQCSGSGMKKWLLTIDKDGTVSGSRYGNTSYESFTAQTESSEGVWLPFHACYIVN